MIVAKGFEFKDSFSSNLGTATNAERALCKIGFGVQKVKGNRDEHRSNKVN
jgi:hypothetical protein